MYGSFCIACTVVKKKNIFRAMFWTIQSKDEGKFHATGVKVARKSLQADGCDKKPNLNLNPAPNFSYLSSMPSWNS